MINILDLQAEYNSVKNEIGDAVHWVLESGHFVLGENVSALESEIAKYCNAKYAVGVASGTDALFLTLKALGLKEGDEIITTPLTFIATAEAISYTGAKPVFVDVDPNTHNIDASKIAKAITRKTRAIIPVHLWGLPADMEAIITIAQDNALFIIEDCAQAFGAEYKDKKVGSFGNAGCFSFFPTKNLGAYGDAGMIITNDKGIFEKLKLLHVHGSRARGLHEIIGYNSRLDEIQAAILRVKLRYVDKWNDARRRNASIYNSIFGVQGTGDREQGEDYKHVYHQYTIEIDNREKVLAYLSNKGISAFVYYPTPLHLQKAYKHLGYKEGDFPASESIGKRMLSLPVHPFLTEDEIKTVAAAVIESMKD